MVSPIIVTVVSEDGRAARSGRIEIEAARGRMQCRAAQNSERSADVGLVRIPDSSWTLRHFQKMPETVIESVSAGGSFQFLAQEILEPIYGIRASL